MPYASFCFKFAQYICDVRRVIAHVFIVFQSSKGMLSMKLPNKPPNTIYCPAASCCTTCCPRYLVTHHAAHHITLPQSSANHAVQSTQHTAHQAAQRNIMPNTPTDVSFCPTSTIPLNTTCCKTYRSPQHVAKTQHQVPNTTCYPACRPTQHHAVHHIAELSMLHSIPLTTICRPTHHHAVHHIADLNLL